jgi:hypothetical protein
MLERADIDLLGALAETPGPSSVPETVDTIFDAVTKSGAFDVERWLLDFGVEFVGKAPWADGTKWILKCCPFNHEHNEPNKAIVGQLANGAIIAKCQHASCAGKKWHDLRDLKEPGWRDKSTGPRRSETLESAEKSKQWPVLDVAALHGIAGEIVRAIEPSTESASVAILIQLLVYFGNLIGRGPFFEVEATEHHTNLFALLVGKTSKGRKGTSENWILKLMRSVDEPWVKERVKDGLSSGEGLMYSIRDSTEKKEKVKGKNEERVIVDPGITDKRALFRESEFASVLTMAGREGNVLSMALRNLWDGNDTGTLTKQSPLRVTKPHLSISGHITLEELHRKMPEVEGFNGFANRFLWICVDRSKRLPLGGALVDLGSFAGRLVELLAIVQSTTQMKWDEEAPELWVPPTTQMKWDEEATKLWVPFYTDPARELPGKLGAVTSRSEPQTLRLSMIYALLDGSVVIRADHLRAAIALWQYAEDSARYIFGDATGIPKEDKSLALEDKVLTVILAGPVTRTGIHKATSNKVDGDVLTSVLTRLQHLGKIKSEKVETRGREATVWTAVDSEPRS